MIIAAIAYEFVVEKPTKLGIVLFLTFVAVAVVGSVMLIKMKK